MAGVDLLAPLDPPSRQELDSWRAAAHGGAGSPWLKPAQAVALARFALEQGEGVCLMEAATLSLREPPGDTGCEILGDDTPGENWQDHRDPARAYALMQRKLDAARAFGGGLQYKIWLRPAGG